MDRNTKDTAPNEHDHNAETPLGNANVPDVDNGKLTDDKDKQIKEESNVPNGKPIDEQTEEGFKKSVDRILQKLDREELTYGQAEREFNKLEEGRDVDNVNHGTTESKSHNYEMKQGDKHDPETTFKYCSHVQLQREHETDDTEANVTQSATECKQESHSWGSSQGRHRG